MSLPPLIVTPRLRLRAHDEGDLDACAAMWAEPAVFRFISGKPSTKQQAWARILNYAGLWQLLGFGYWAVEERDSGEYVGDLGFADFKREIESAQLVGLPELGWALAGRFHGRGYATEALLAVLGWADAHLTSKRTACIVDPANVASIRVAEKCGYREVERTRYNGEPTIVFLRG